MTSLLDCGRSLVEEETTSRPQHSCTVYTGLQLGTSELVDLVRLLAPLARLPPVNLRQETTRSDLRGA
jgi:hypothetical protein